MSWNIQLYPAKFLLVPGLAWQPALEKTKVKLDYLTDIDMLLIVEKGIRWGICHCIYRYAKANNKYMKIAIKITNRHIFNIGSWIIYMVRQKLPVNNFVWIKDTSQFNKDFINYYNEESGDGYFLEVNVQYIEKITWTS